MSRILIVEDEKKIARFLELELTHEGYEVQTAGDGRSGLELAFASDKKSIRQSTTSFVRCYLY